MTFSFSFFTKLHQLKFPTIFHCHWHSITDVNNYSDNGINANNSDINLILKQYRRVMIHTAIIDVRFYLKFRLFDFRILHDQKGQ